MPISLAIMMPVVVLPYCPFVHDSNRFEGAVSGLLLIDSGFTNSCKTVSITVEETQRFLARMDVSLKSKLSNS